MYGEVIQSSREVVSQWRSLTENFIWRELPELQQSIQ